MELDVHSKKIDEVYYELKVNAVSDCST